MSSPAISPSPSASPAACSCASSTWSRGGEHTVAFDEPAYSVHTGGNAEFETASLRFVYTSLTTPASTYDYDLATRERVLKKRQPVPGYEPSLYASERIAARAGDGTAVPISLVYRRDRKRAGPQPLLLYGYGSYGIPIDPTFSQTRVSLLDRGVVFAIAHIRGGGDLGRSWYEAGKMANKQTTFDDFIACAEALIAARRTTPQELAIEGGSAGGLLMGAVVNQRPELFRAVVAEVPFMDVVTTMLDETMPLTVGEFIEWGNPKIAAEYAWLRAYSPYDNLKRGAFPAMLVRTGLNDTQVAYWEPCQVRRQAAHAEDRRAAAAPEDQPRGRPRRCLGSLRFAARDRRGRRVPAGRARPRARSAGAALTVQTRPVACSCAAMRAGALSAPYAS